MTPKLQEDLKVGSAPSRSLYLPSPQRSSPAIPCSSLHRGGDGWMASLTRWT